MTATVMITTGGTGGHVFPGLAVAAKLLARGCRVFWLGTREGMEARLVPAHGVEFEAVSFRGVRGKGWRTLVVGPFALLRACVDSLRVIRRRRPNVVLGFGGFASFPGALMGVAAGKHLVVHDANAVAGLANRVLALGADRVLLGFPGAMRGSRTTFVGNPLRDDIVALPPPAERFAGRTGPLRVLVVGGSLGAAALNEALPAALAAIDEAKRPQVVHQAGERHVDALRAAYARAGARAECVAFIDDMAARLDLADLVVCRAGAATVSELCAAGVASVLVPFIASTTAHQRDNALYMAQHGAAWHLPQAELTPERLAGLLRDAQRERLQAMAAKARALSRPRAAARVADEIERLVVRGAA